MKIIYPTDQTDIASAPFAVVHPTGAVALAVVAERDLPEGVPFRVVTEEFVLALRREDRSLWRADFTQPDGVGGT